MLAIIETGGKQHKVAVGQKIKVEKLAARNGDVWQDLKVGDAVTFDKVLLVSKGEEQSEPVVGNPFVAQATVSGKVVEQGKDRKVVVFKQKQRKGYRRKRGHRQRYTLVEITGIQEA